MKKLLAGIAVATISFGAANAATPIATSTTSGNTITQVLDYGSNLTDFSNLSSQFALFDTQGGTLQLTGVTLTTTFNFNTQITVTNTGSGNATGNAYTQSYLGLSANNSGINSLLSGNYDTATITTSTGSFAYGSNASTGVYNKKMNTIVGQSFNVAEGTQQTLAAINATEDDESVSLASASDSASIANFLASGGTNSFNFLASTLTSTTQTITGGNAKFAQRTTADPVVTLTYTFAQVAGATVPEPATWTMMIAGFGMVGFGMRRRGTAALFS